MADSRSSLGARLAARVHRILGSSDDDGAMSVFPLAPHGSALVHLAPARAFEPSGKAEQDAVAMAFSNPISPAKARERVRRAFDISMPVRERSGLTGRIEELELLFEVMVEQGKHVVLFGQRGSGKTSLGRVFGSNADEKRFLVIYQSASGDSSFEDLLTPSLAELFEEASNRSARTTSPPIATDARRVANWLVDNLDRRAILIIDEFDRITNTETKAQVASLMKLLSDMRSQVQLMVIGIARNVDELLASHPSLRRHVAAVQVGPLVNSALERLLDQCCKQAGVEITPASRHKLVCLALGSPYHLRLFGLHSTLAAERAGSTEVTPAMVETGLGEALAEWSQLGGEALNLDALAEGRPASRSLLVFAALAAYSGIFDEQDVAIELVREGVDQHTSADEAACVIDVFSELLVRQDDGRYRLVDGMPAQFLALLALGYKPRGMTPVARTKVGDLLSLRASGEGQV